MALLAQQPYLPSNTATPCIACTASLVPLACTGWQGRTAHSAAGLPCTLTFSDRATPPTISAYAVENKPAVLAKAITELEFTGIMGEIAAIADSQVSQMRPGLKPLYCFDNPTVQKGADLTTVGIAKDQLLPLAPCSPDFNKPIEHTFAIMKAAFRDHLYGNYQITGHDVTPTQLQVVVDNIRKTVTGAMVMKDAIGLIDTWNVVCSAASRMFMGWSGKMLRGSAGNWALRPER